MELTLRVSIITDLLCNTRNHASVDIERSFTLSGQYGLYLKNEWSWFGVDKDIKVDDPGLTLLIKIIPK